MPCEAAQHRGEFDRSGTQIGRAREPRESGLLEIAPELRVELIRPPTSTLPSLEGLTADVVDQFVQLGVVIRGTRPEDASGKGGHCAHRSPRLFAQALIAIPSLGRRRRAAPRWSHREA